MSDNKQKYIDLLKSKLTEVDGLKEKQDYTQLNQWKNEVSMVLDNLILDPDSKYLKQFRSIRYESGVVHSLNPQMNKRNDAAAFQNGIEEAKSVINSIIFGVEEGLV